MSNAFSESVEGYVEWANAYLAKAQQELKVTTDKVHQGGFTADDAVDAMVRTALLMFNGFASLASESMDAAATMAKFSATRTITSKPISVNKPGAWNLAITTPLVNAKNVPLPSGSVRLVPDSIADGMQETFRVEAVVQEVPGGVYAGAVTATSAAGTAGPVTLVAKVQVG